MNAVLFAASSEDDPLDLLGGTGDFESIEKVLQHVSYWSMSLGVMEQSRS